MRRIVVFDWLSADGYFAGPDGNLSWVVPAEEQSRAAADGIAGFDTVLFGRRSGDVMLRYARSSEGRASG